MTTESYHYSPLVHGGSTCKYDHHPIAAVQALAASGLFSHLTLEQLIAAVKKYGSTRAVQIEIWDNAPNFQMRKARQNMINSEVCLPETAEMVARYKGTTCLFCKKSSFIGYSSRFGTMEEVEIYDQLVWDQVELRLFFLEDLCLNRRHRPATIPVPVACRNCLNIIAASNGLPTRNDFWGISGDDIVALSQITALLEHQARC